MPMQRCSCQDQRTAYQDLFSSLIVTRDQTQIVRFGCRYLYPLSCLVGSCHGDFINLSMIDLLNYQIEKKKKGVVSSFVSGPKQAQWVLTSSLGLLIMAPVYIRKQIPRSCPTHPSSPYCPSAFQTGPPATCCG